ncbi:lipopolysaccharide heptosyltransferase II [Derxia lacustris]|uniref:lipopolysaccharide heptosyltransferase II n=1 Tax=Derxia lacustris TaxID=764842 RepID=UPI000A172ED3|nr:lipopolysaccharide heptosyltransferase II [Derxia lacustris]
MRILVVAPNWIGDAIMAQPLIRRLRLQHLRARIEVLAPRHLAAVFECMNEVDRVQTTSFEHGKLQWKERVATARALRAGDAHGPFTHAWVLPNSWKSALVPWLARIPVRCGYTGEGRIGLLNRRWPNPPKGNDGHRPPMIDTYAALAGGFERHYDWFGSDRPRLSIDPALVAIAKAKFIDRHAARPLIGFCPGAEYGPAKRWPVEHFARLAGLVAQQHPEAAFVCLGSPKDRPVAAEIATLAQVEVVNLCGATSLKEVVALMRNLQAVVTNDSGLMHMAAALDVPVVALYGSTDPRHTPPHNTQAEIARIPIECSPCFARECPLGHFRCMRDLTPELVYEKLAARLGAARAQPTPSPGQGADGRRA